MCLITLALKGNMETFFTQIALRYNEDPKNVIVQALQYFYALDDMLYILYCYQLNLKDPFVDKDFYTNGLKKQGIRHIINALYQIHTLISSEENKIIAELVMSDYGVCGYSYYDEKYFI